MKAILVTLLLALAAQNALAQTQAQNPPARSGGGGGTGTGNGPATKEGGGSGAGNGTLSAREAYLQRLRDELGARPEMNPEGVRNWCSSIESMLRREERRANTELFREHKLAAKQILFDALVVAGSSIGDDLPPRTKTIIDRGIKTLMVLDEKLPDSDVYFLTTKVDFLTQYYRLIYQVIRDYDLPLYIDYRYRYGGCANAVCPPEFDLRGLERIALKIAAQQLELATRFTEITDRVSSIGDPVAFLRVTQMISGYVGREDLNVNLFAYSKSCVKGELIRLSDDLWSFLNTGDRSVFLSLPYALAEVRAILDYSIWRIGQQSTLCYDPWGPNAPSYPHPSRRWP